MQKIQLYIVEFTVYTQGKCMQPQKLSSYKFIYLYFIKTYLLHIFILYIY